MSHTDSHTRSADRAARITRRLERKASADFRRRKAAPELVSLDPRDYAKGA